jgi:hypothetical protein
MIRTYLSNDYIKRTIRPTLTWTQATPKPCFLDPNWTRSVPIWPGMGFVRTGGDLVTLAGANNAQMNNAYSSVTNGTAGMYGTAGTSSNGSYVSTSEYGTPPIYGLGALYVGGDGIDELLYAGINAFAVWVLGPDAEFEILAPAFDPTSTWNDPPVVSGAGYYGAGSALIGVALQNASGAQGSAQLGTGTLQGQLVPWSVSQSISAPVARLLKVNSSTKITIGGLSPFDINAVVAAASATLTSGATAGTIAVG